MSWNQGFVWTPSLLLSSFPHTRSPIPLSSPHLPKILSIGRLVGYLMFDLKSENENCIFLNFVFWFLNENVLIFLRFTYGKLNQVNPKLGLYFISPPMKTINVSIQFETQIWKWMNPIFNIWFTIKYQILKPPIIQSLFQWM